MVVKRDMRRRTDAKRIRETIAKEEVANFHMISSEISYFHTDYR